MPKPSHVEAFDFITEGTQNEIRNYIAFGMFMQSEKSWLAQRPSEPSDAEYRRYHQALLTSHERERFREAADAALKNFATKAISAERSELLTHHRKFRCLGVVEATLGAFVWTAILIVVTSSQIEGALICSNIIGARWDMVD
jgi:hypothetical protein